MAVPGAAAAFTAFNRLNVNPVDAATFEVVGKGATNGAEYWCAAGDFADRTLRAGWTDRIYIARGRGPSETTGRRSAVQFTLSPEAAGIVPAEPSLRLNALEVGDNMSVQAAKGYCQVLPSRRF
ncbi:MAG TPA: hypothetical protein DEA05_13975 [Rhodobacteraceae bacterium]|nr:hypothetical protein [Paracoccaceae bacterium]